jgi:hypothetical protein
MGDNITVLPNLSGSRFNKKHGVDGGYSSSGVANSGKHPKSVNLGESADPDVTSILNPKKSSNFDILGMKHEPTEEESVNGDTNKTEKSQEKSSQWNWLIISLSVVVVVLIIAIVWYVLKQNDEAAAVVVPPYVLHPNAIPLTGHTSTQNNMWNPQQYGRVNPVNKPQTEHLPIQTKSMGQPVCKPSKSELESTLKKMEKMEIMETVEEMPEEPKPQKEDNNSIVDDASDKKPVDDADLDQNPVLDDNLSNQFYANLQENIDMDNADSDEEEGR